MTKLVLVANLKAKTSHGGSLPHSPHKYAKRSTLKFKEIEQKCCPVDRKSRNRICRERGQPAAKENTRQFTVLTHLLQRISSSMLHEETDIFRL